jgi:hypothetical protein
MLTLKEIAHDWGCTPQYVSLCVKQGCPKIDFQSARDWRVAHTGKSSKKTNGAIPTAEEMARKHSDDPKIVAELAELFKMLINSAIAAESAWQMLDDAFKERKPTQISVYLNLHSKAVEARVKAERMVREELERRGILITLTEAQAKGRRLVEIVVSRLSAMPQNLAHAVNPGAPDHAFEILQRECTAILADAQKTLT